MLVCLDGHKTVRHGVLETCTSWQMERACQKKATSVQQDSEHHYLSRTGSGISSNLGWVGGWTPVGSELARPPAHHRRPQGPKNRHFPKSTISKNIMFSVSLHPSPRTWGPRGPLAPQGATNGPLGCPFGRKNHQQLIFLDEPDQGNLK